MRKGHSHGVKPQIVSSITAHGWKYHCNASEGSQAIAKHCDIVVM